MQQRLMGFFRLGHFPFVVAMEIDRFDEKGGAVVKQVGTYSAENILCVRPLKAGKTLAEAIEGVRAAYRKRNREVLDEHVGKVEDMLGVKVR
jgi:hypothetical protein